MSNSPVLILGEVESLSDDSSVSSQTSACSQDWRSLNKTRSNFYNSFKGYEWLREFALKKQEEENTLQIRLIQTSSIILNQQDGSLQPDVREELIKGLNKTVQAIWDGKTFENETADNYRMNKEAADRSRLSTILDRPELEDNEFLGWIQSKILKFEKYQVDDHIPATFKPRLAEINKTFQRFGQENQDTLTRIDLEILEREVENTLWVMNKITEYEALLQGSLIAKSFKPKLTKIIKILYYNKRHQSVLGKPLPATLKDFEEEINNHLKQTQSELNMSKIAEGDVDGLLEFLENTLIEEYGSSTSTSNYEFGKFWRALGMYLAWKEESNFKKRADLEGQLTDFTGISLVNLEKLLEIRLTKMIEASNLDERWVKDRLCRFATNSCWHRQNHKLAERLCWEKLAAKLVLDRQQLNLLMPGGTLLANEGEELNKKGYIHFGLVYDQGKYFSRLKGPDAFTLSKESKKREQEAEQRRLKLARSKEKSGGKKSGK